MLRSLKLPRLRLYQQIIIYFILVVFVPLVSVSFFIYSINQNALQKELTKFTKLTSEAIFSDLLTELSWQKRQVNLYGNQLFSSGNFDQQAKQIFLQDDTIEAIGFYDTNGNAINRIYRHPDIASSSRQLPETMDDEQLHITNESLEVVYAQPENPENTTYYLRAFVPVNESNIAFYSTQTRFDYLHHLIHGKNKDLYDGFFIVDHRGQIIAGPRSMVEAGQQISPDNLAIFNSLKPGLTKMVETSGKTIDSQGDNENPLQKAFIKLPDLGWGIVVESPYEFRQVYIKRARNQTLLLIFGSLILFVALTLFYVLGLNRNFRQLTKGIKAIAEKKYSRRIRLLTNWFTPYEVVQLSGEFNRMARKISDAWNESQQLTTELRDANEKLSQLDEMKSNLIDTVSHELRTPLTSIKGYSSRLIRYDESLDPDTRVKNLKVIKRQADRLGRLVDDLLAIPELESDNIRIFLDQVYLSEWIERSVHFIQQKEHREIQVTMPDDTEDVHVLADPDRLDQVFLNLLDNAVKYSLPETPIEIHVEPVDGHVNIRIRNQSEAMTQQQLDSLFDKFTRLDESTTRTTRGTGLGLFITKGLVEAMGGHVSLSYENHFFTVAFTLTHIQSGMVNPPVSLSSVD